MIGAKDRDYYRVENNKTLIEEAKYNPSVELCIVLAERLEDALEKLASEDIKIDD